MLMDSGGSIDYYSNLCSCLLYTSLFFRLWNALNSLPEIQGRRVDAHLILGKSYRQIAREEGVDKSAVRCSVKSGIKRMKKYLQKNI